MRSRKRIGFVLILAAMIGGVALGIDPVPPVPLVRPTVAEVFSPIIPVSNNEPAPVPAPRPEASVSLEWSGPPMIKVNHPGVYTLTVKNTSLQFVQKVVVQVRASKTAEVQETNPVAKKVEGVHLWELGTLEPRETREIKLTLLQTSKGELGCQAWVTFTGTAGMKVQVSEPKLESRIEVPATVLLGEPIPIRTIVKNVGDCEVGLMRYELKATPGLERIGLEQALPIGGQKTADFQDEAKTPGLVTYELFVTGDGVARTVAKATTKVLVPKLEVSVVGPAEVQLNRKADYKIRVKNIGDVPVYGTQLQYEVPAYLLPETNGSGGEFINQLPVGETREIPLRLQMSQAGPVNIVANAYAFQLARSTMAEAKKNDLSAASRLITQVQGIPALRMELVDTADPIEKGQQTTYEIRITNTGSRADNNIVVSCPLPEQLKFVSCKGPVGHTVEELNNCAVIKFEPVRELAPKTEAVFRITVKAVQTGDIRFKALLNSQHLSTSVVKEESTRVYGE